MMKIITLIILLTMTVFVLGGCIGDVEYSESSVVDESTDTSATSQDVSTETSDDESDVETSEDVYEKKYPFLKSEYVITSKIMSGDTVFVCKYYFVNKVVAGAKLMTVFDDAQTASDYYDVIIDDYPDAKLDRLTVTHFMADDDDYFYGYSPEKLKFALETAGYAVSVGFDLDEFYDDESETDKP